MLSSWDRMLHILGMLHEVPYPSKNTLTAIQGFVDCFNLIHSANHISRITSKTKGAKNRAKIGKL